MAESVSAAWWLERPDHGYQSWLKNRPTVIAVLKATPEAYLKVIASLLPQIGGAAPGPSC
jgi:hypothetical protein